MRLPSLLLTLSLLALPTAHAISGPNNLRAFSKNEICIGSPHAQVGDTVNAQVVERVEDALRKTSARLGLGFENTPLSRCAGYLRFAMWSVPGEGKLLYLSRLELVVPKSQLGGVRSLTDEALNARGTLEFAGVWDVQDLGLLPSVQAAPPLAVGLALELFEDFVAHWKRSR